MIQHPTYHRFSLRGYFSAICLLLFIPIHAGASPPDEGRTSSAAGSRAEGEVVLAAENVEEQDDDGFGNQAAPPGEPEERLVGRIFRAFTHLLSRASRPYSSASKTSVLK